MPTSAPPGVISRSSLRYQSGISAVDGARARAPHLAHGHRGAGAADGRGERVVVAARPRRALRPGGAQRVRHVGRGAGGRALGGPTAGLVEQGRARLREPDPQGSRRGRHRHLTRRVPARSWPMATWTYAGSSGWSPRATRCSRWASPTGRSSPSGRHWPCGVGPALREVEEWAPARAEIERLEELRLETEEAVVDASLRVGLQAGILAEARSRVTQAPVRERRWALLALAQYLSGSQADALATLRRAREMLSRELGLDPGPELVELEQAMLRQDAVPERGDRTASPRRAVPLPRAAALRRRRRRLLLRPGHRPRRVSATPHRERRAGARRPVGQRQVVAVASRRGRVLGRRGRRDARSCRRVPPRTSC